ncbi:ribonuclease H-like protein [Pseudovirgaria hyperparasitica]|uniref:ribonuclease H n=1 Tax=Pseudovirgaria hyperparasitica TaxID=470096 RepID=A0A6A6VZK1_9PEZI|nr:ribonuclease H-like protein [Pseudovirgaria hyperparasitica]KAF2755665.1 ribonuclease H-like protein [Pseudovirgaria hyperparasitica]
MPSSKASSGVKSDLKSAATSSNASSGTKRKRIPAIKFYAVRTGLKPGVYHSWSDCQDQIKGFKVKSFPTLTEAEAFVKATSPPKTPQAQKFYAVQSGRVPGVYTDWGEASQQITGWTKPKHKGFTTRAEAEAFVAAGPNAGGPVSNVSVELDNPAPDAVATPPPTKRQKKTSTQVLLKTDSAEDEAGAGTLPSDAEDGFDDRIILNPDNGKVVYKTEAQRTATKLHPTGNLKDPEKYMKIYTDGSSLGNQNKNACAGVGVFFGPSDSRNVSEPLAGPRQTNQRAELTAIQRALDIAPIDRPVEIITDSNYSINCVTVWFQKWRENNWINSSRKPVENKDLIEAIVTKIEMREQHCRVGTKFTWVKGHSSDPGNVAADHLAVNGARLALGQRGSS